MWRNDTKCKCMFMFPLKNLARKGLTPVLECTSTQSWGTRSALSLVLGSHSFTFITDASDQKVCCPNQIIKRQDAQVPMDYPSTNEMGTIGLKWRTFYNFIQCMHIVCRGRKRLIKCLRFRLSKWRLQHSAISVIPKMTMQFVRMKFVFDIRSLWEVADGCWPERCNKMCSAVWFSNESFSQWHAYFPDFNYFSPACMSQTDQQHKTPNST